MRFRTFLQPDRGGPVSSHCENFDARCGLCVKFRGWMEMQPKWVAVEFLPYDSVAAAERFPGLVSIGADRDVVVLANDGRWWQGTGAWLVCLWATREYRVWSYRLAAPGLQSLVKKAVNLLSDNRISISRILRLRGDQQLAAALDSIPSPICNAPACHV